MEIRAVRGQCARWAFIVVLRTVTAVPAERAPEAIRRAALFLFLFAVAYLWWLLTGRGPWRWLGLNAASVVPRGVPDGAFWRAGAQRFPSPPDVA